MKKQYTKKQITEAIAYWQKQLNEAKQFNEKDADSLEQNVKMDEARHDGHWLPKHPTQRNPTEKPTIYYLGVDESDDFRGYGSYVMPNGNLTSSASNDDFRSAAVTKVPAQLKAMIDKAVARYGKDKYIFVFKEAYTYGTQTHKSHARPSVIDVWYPNGQYWRYGLSAVDALQENDMLKGKPHNNHLNESGNFNKTEHLSIACASNPDFSGEFFKSDVEEEMRDVGIDMSKEGPTGWMSYIFGHMFSDTNEWTAALEDSVLLDNVKKVILSLDGNLVVIEKKQ